MIDKKFLAVLFIFALTSGLLILVHGISEAYAEAAYEQGYSEGLEHAVELLKDVPKLTPQEEKEIAVMWWTGTQDMLGARKALCGKPIQPKPKKE